MSDVKSKNLYELLGNTSDQDSDREPDPPTKVVTSPHRELENVTLRKLHPPSHKATPLLHAKAVEGEVDDAANFAVVKGPFKIGMQDVAAIGADPLDRKKEIDQGAPLARIVGCLVATVEPVAMIAIAEPARLNTKNRPI